MSPLADLLCSVLNIACENKMTFQIVIDALGVSGL